MTAAAKTDLTAPVADLFDDARVASIYRTAAELIHAKGFAGTSMNEIAEAADLTKPGLYYHVKNKRELLFRITSFAMDLLDARVVAQAESIDEPAVRLRTIVHGHARLLLHEPGALAILIDEVDGLDPQQRAIITRRKRRYYDFLRDAIIDLQRAGRLRPATLDPTVTAFNLLGMIMWTARWYRVDGALGPDAVADTVATMAMHAVLGDDDAQQRTTIS
ncbi:MAG: TetR/AcrR family transcriptional regulator [Acidobacteriota bacterium]